jgi:hypothetical protein
MDLSELLCTYDHGYVRALPSPVGLEKMEKSFGLRLLQLQTWTFAIPRKCSQHQNLAQLAIAAYFVRPYMSIATIWLPKSLKFTYEAISFDQAAWLQQLT